MLFLFLAVCFSSSHLLFVLVKNFHVKVKGHNAGLGKAEKVVEQGRDCCRATTGQQVTSSPPFIYEA